MIVTKMIKEKLKNLKQDPLDRIISMIGDLLSNPLGEMEYLVARAANSLPIEKVDKVSIEGYSVIDKCDLMREMIRKYNHRPSKSLDLVTDYALKYGEKGRYVHVKNIHLDILK